MKLENIFIKHGHIIIFDSPTSGIIKSLKDNKETFFTLTDKHLLLKPPAEALSLKLRHFIELKSSQLISCYPKM